MEFDFPGFTVEDAVGFKLLVRGLQLLLAQHESMPVDVVFRTWNNTKGQVSLNFASVCLTERRKYTRPPLVINSCVIFDVVFPDCGH